MAEESITASVAGGSENGCENLLRIRSTQIQKTGTQSGLEYGARPKSAGKTVGRAAPF